MKDYIGPSIMALGLFAFFVGLMIYHRSQTPKPGPGKKKGVEVVCKTCGGTGETEQDVNLLMAKATYSIWLNGHSYGCEACNKFPDGPPCEADRKKYKEIMDKYEELGPKIEKAACPGCMGAGRRLSAILNERYHEIWREEMNNLRNGLVKRPELRDFHPVPQTRAREIMLRARRRWHIMLRSLGAATALEQWDPTPPEPYEVRVADPSGFELELPNGFVVMPLELAQKILVLGGLP